MQGWVGRNFVQAQGMLIKAFEDGQAAVGTLQPIARVGNWIHSVFQFTPSASSIQKQNKQLQHQVDDLTARLFEANQKIEVSHNLQELTAYGKSTQHQLVPAAVIASSPDPGIQSIIINHGTSAGIQLGQVVVNQNGYVVGKVVAVHQAASTVLLISDRQSVISARVQNDVQSPGIVYGEHGLTLQMEYIPKTDSIKVGQTIVTSGTDAGIPPGVLIGTISAISLRVGELFQSAALNPASSLQGLQTVAVIIG